MNHKSSEKDNLQTIEVTTQDLPLSCPRANSLVWNKHPRVYLAIEETGEATCPYCGTRYRLSE